MWRVTSATAGCSALLFFVLICSVLKGVRPSETFQGFLTYSGCLLDVGVQISKTTVFKELQSISISGQDRLRCAWLRAGKIMGLFNY